MKKSFVLSFALALTWIVAGDALNVSAQDKRERLPVPPTVLRDADLEKESKHNLEVARHYFRLKKAYRAAIARCEEIIAGDPTFSRLDEALYIAGLSSLRLSENQGKQAATLPADKLREDARDYLSRIVNDFPDSKFREEAETQLSSLGGVKKASQQ
ncbi:MAG TPA: outer membrane protein assembly factor BamD [Pyrinomonadaceae bacterium]|jgi:outer membrane protein assembly factor BamD (BamD/ComL family)